MIKLGGIARRVRESKNISQKDAAELLEVSVVHLCNIENNKSAPSADLIARYRDLWNIDLYVLAWCLKGSTDKLPKQVQKAASQLSAYWKSQYDLSSIPD